MITIALDPSINSCGLAAYVDGTLSMCCRVTCPLGTDSPIGVRCLAMAGEIIKVLERHSLLNGIVELVMEWPQVLRNTKSKGDPNDLIPMAGVGMALATLIGVRSSSGLRDLITPTPNEWIHQCPKQCPKCKKTPGSKRCPVCKGSAWRTPRGFRIADVLTLEERERVPDQHDAIDAAGLGAWRKKRLVLGRVFPGAV